MMTLSVLTTDNKELKKIELDKSIFAVPVRRQLLYDCVQIYRRNQRQGTVQAKFRHEVAGSTKKIYRQKGTGNARHGGIRANIFVGGGIAFPPRPRDWYSSLPQSFKQEALRSALALRKKEGNLLLVEEIPAEKIKTKAMAQQLKKWGIVKGLVVIEASQEKIWKSIRNIRHVALTTADSLNAFDILKYEKVVLTQKALSKLEKRLS